MTQAFLDELIPNLDAVARQAFHVLAGMTPESINTPPGSFTVEASISYEGEEKAPQRLLIRANRKFAVDFSAHFLGLPVLVDINEDVIDAFGELANTIGGNFKGLLSADTVLSTPVVYLINHNTEIQQSNAGLAEMTYTFPESGQCLVRLTGPGSQVAPCLGQTATHDCQLDAEDFSAVLDQ